MDGSPILSLEIVQSIPCSQKLCNALNREVAQFPGIAQYSLAMCMEIFPKKHPYKIWGSLLDSQSWHSRYF